MSITFFVAFLGALLIQAQDQSGFISIDCGASVASSTDLTTGINYTSDANFISRTIASELVNNEYMYQRQLWNVRSFPEGKRNCYKINITRGSKYLIRTTFLYGNYDMLNKAPMFDILLGANWWFTVTLANAIISLANEIIHVPSLDYIQICLVNTGFGIPFISTIEIRTLKDDTYITQSGSLQTYFRWDLGSNKSYRYKYDVYDRFWYSSNSSELTQLSASVPPANSLERNVYKVPEIVMSTAVTPANASAPLVISWEPEHPTDQFYVYMHFMEIQELPENQTREFTITLNGELRASKFSPEYRSVNTIPSRSAISGVENNISLETESSTLPPSINAIEIYRVIDFQQSDTNQGDGNP